MHSSPFHTRGRACVRAVLLVLVGACSSDLPTAAPSAPASDALAAARPSLALSAGTSTSLYVADTLRLAAPPAIAAGTVTWSSSSSRIASVTGGLVTAVTSGTAVIRVTNGTATDSITVVVRTPSYPAPTATTQAAVLAFMGHDIPTVATISAKGGAWAKYESDFARYAEIRWTSDGAHNGNANYYDRAMIYYVWWARTGNAVFLDRAHQLALNHRAYLEKYQYNAQPYNTMIDGVALHALVTGDARSKVTVARTADRLGGARSWWSVSMGDTIVKNFDARNRAKVLNTVLVAWQLKLPSPGGEDYAARLRDLLTQNLKAQSPDGAWRTVGQCKQNKPFMTGMINDIFIRYYYEFNRDARIVTSIRKSADYMWANDWLPANQAFKYLTADCPTADDTAKPSPDLNMLVVNTYGFLRRITGSKTDEARGDAVFAGGVNGAWLGGTKQFNQNYTSAYRYFGLRF